MTNCKYAKFEDGKFLFPQSSKKVIMTSSFDKNNLGEESFALGMEIHRDKKKMGVSGLCREHTLKSVLKIYSMHARKSMPVL